MNTITNKWLLVFLFVAFSVAAQAAVIDTYEERFDGRADDATIHEVDSWSVDQGETMKAITQDSTTYTGTGKALELTGAETTVSVSRKTTYGGLTPCWLEFIVKAGVGAQSRSLPSTGIAAVSFDYKGKIYASNGSSWQDTGETFTEGDWYRVTLKLDFKNKLYDIYISSVAVPEIEFIADKTGLAFIDTSISSLSELGFDGAYNVDRADDTYIDDLVVHFIDRLEMITASQTLVEGQPSGPITVQLQNAYSEPQTAWCDLILELKSSSPGGEFSLSRDAWMPTAQVILTENAYSAGFYYKDTKPGKPIITINEYPNRGWEEATQQQIVVSAVAGFEIEVITPQVAAEYFSMIITARDDEGNVNETYSGEVEILVDYLSPNSGTMRITPETISGFSKGRLEVSAMYPDCGTIAITVEDVIDPSKVGSSGPVLFIPASFNLSADSLQVVGRPFSLGVSALNALGAHAPNYEGPTELSFIGVSPEEIRGGAISPSTIDLGGFVNGLAEVMVSYNLWGTIKMEANDLACPAQAGMSEAITFQPGGLLVEVISPPSGRDFFYLGETIGIAVSLVDEEGLAIANYQGTVEISSTIGLGLPDEYLFTELDEGKHTFHTNVDSAGIYTVSCKEKASELEGEGSPIEVREASLVVESTVAPVGTTEVTIKLVDEQGNLIDSESELSVLIGLEEEIDDGSASSLATSMPITFVDGRAKILISNTQAEIVTISPSSQYKFKIKKGTVTFGRIAKTGVGTLMWREIKE